MDWARRAIIKLFALIVSTATTIAVLIYGWGLTPHSWTWVIVISFLGHMLGALFFVIGDHKDK